MTKNGQLRELFVGTGFQKCGSSSLYWLVRDLRPDIMGPREGLEGKEAHGIPVEGASKRRYQQKLGRGPRVDVTPSYAYSVRTLATLHQWFPRAKVMLIVRNPVQRFYSALDHGKRLGMFPVELTDSEALERALSAPGRGHYRTLIDWGHYLPGIRASVELFGEDQVYVTSLEALTNPRRQLEEVSRLANFLSADPGAAHTAVFKKTNATSGSGNSGFSLAPTQRSEAVQSRLQSFYAESWRRVVGYLESA